MSGSAGGSSDLRISSLRWALAMERQRRGPTASARRAPTQPGAQLVKIVYDELTNLLGERREGLKLSSVPPTVVMLVGLQGSGKTTTAAKLALKLQKEGRQTRLIAADVYRPAAIDPLEDFYPERVASRILQQGDIVSLVEKAQEAFDEAEAKRLEKKVKKEGMDLADFLAAMKQLERLGPLEGVLKMLPGVNTKVLKQVRATDPRRLKHLEAIVLSMTPEERRTPGIINGSRRARIARGSGRPINEVNRLLDQFRQMQKM